ncbi:MAG: ribonuclease R [Hahellaceae bacterium]|jgi:ribonuclease R|nr:ribonuclease R [Hahellaceae bacterium]
MTKKKKKSFKDPFAKREAQKYENPIVSRELILTYLETLGSPVTHEEACQHFGLSDEADVEALRRRLIAMCRDGQLVCGRRGAYGLAKRMDLIRGRVSGHRDGFGFLIPEAGGDDYYLPFHQMTQVFDGDIVLIREAGRSFKDKKEGVIVEVLQRNTRELVGRLYRDDGVTHVVPDNRKISQDVRIPDHATLGATSGQYVNVRITRQPGFKISPIGEVTEILGEHMAPGMEIDIALRTYNIPFQWPEEVEDEASVFRLTLSEKDKAGRVDLREVPLVTIDGEDARDFDDAVYCCRKKGGGWRLYVAIADVSHYVKPGTALDKEAFNRGNSVYFPNRVVPMLPEVLSNGLCSLNPKVERLCMVCEMTVSEQGKLTGHKFYEGLMRSKARLTYTEVGAFLDEPESEAARSFLEHHGELAEPIIELYALYKALRSARDARGAIDFDTVETRILFDDQRKIEQIVPVVRNDAHKLIEECMLCANVATARFLEKHKIPCLYRVHEGPSAEKLEKLRAFLGEVGLSIGGGTKPRTADYQTLAERIRERPDQSTLQIVMLRSLSQAVYQPENKGHFGLGYEAYTHFTSPIRRYPDLLVHRAIRSWIRSDKASRQVVRVYGTEPLPRNEQYRLEVQDLLVIGEQTSMTERRADDATRDVMAWLKCEYLQDRVGERFVGRVTAVTAFGLFVELNDLYVEGLVHVSSLTSDYYHFDPVKHRLVGERSGETYRLGDEVEVVVARVNLDDRKVDLELIRGDAKGRRGKTPEPPSARASTPSARSKKRPARASKRADTPRSGPSKGAEPPPSASPGKRSRRDQILAEWKEDFDKQKKTGAPKRKGKR